MAVEDGSQPCTIVLHQTPVSKECVLCGSSILPNGALGYLNAPGAKLLCIAPKVSAPNDTEVSIHTSLAERFGFENRMKATLKVIDDVDAATATHVEILFRDQYLSRADMWRLTAQVDDSVLYEGQKLRYLGSVAAVVEAVYIAGDRVDSAYVLHPRSKLIFRSGSARFTILVQISKEMLEYWIDGDLMYERLLYGLLPALFQRWDKLQVRHRVSIVLFGRQQSPGGNLSTAKDEVLKRSHSYSSSGDFFYVVEQDMSGNEWHQLLRKLKLFFNSTKFSQQVCLAKESNMLEGIHLAARDFALESIDMHLTSTGTSIIAITAGSGIFDTEHGLLKRTTELLMGNSIGVDMVSLSPKPFHPVPLFHYKGQGSHEFALPHWIEMSYWRPSESKSISDWLVPDVLEKPCHVSIQHLSSKLSQKVQSASHAMDTADDTIFIPSVHKNIERLSMRTKPPPAVSIRSISPPAEPAEQISSTGMPENSTKQPEMPLKKDPNTEAVQASIPYIERGKREALPVHPLLKTGRKISLGPKGLALGRGTASTTISAQHVQHDKETGHQPGFAPHAASSGLAKQIRDSLARKPSQSSLNSRTASESMSEQAIITQPIQIHAREQNISTTPDDPATVMENTVMAAREDQSLSATPRGKRDSLPLPGMNALEDDSGSISPWLTLLNPCNPRHDNMRVASEYRKWQHVFPRTVTPEDFKWESMCTPAALPLMTEYRISSAALEKHFKKRVRRLVAPSTHNADHNGARQILFELISMRLSAGFQIVPRRSTNKAQRSIKNIDRILLSLSGNFHELYCISDVEVQIVEFERQRGTDNEDSLADNSAIQYSARMRPATAGKLRNVVFPLLGTSSISDWAVLDEQSVNPTALAESQGTMVVRFALLPVPLSKSDQLPNLVRELTDHERHIEGIQKLTQLWQRHRFFTEDDQRHHTSMAKSRSSATEERDPNPLAVEYHTRDPSLVIRVHGPALAGDADNGAGLAPLLSQSDMYHTTDFDIAKLTKHMQDPPPEGIEFKDRLWLTKLHLRCFRGDELTNWLLRVFKDLHTREDAVQLGNQLKDLGIFSHVRNKHEFKDGHYFYQIKSGYRTTDYPDSAGIFGRAMGRSIPPTPGSDAKQSPTTRPIKDSADSGKRTTPTTFPTDKKEVLLSQSMQYNVDTTKRSTQEEIINLHYDRIHNPENCYHIQLDWTSTTPKLIRESVGRWAGLVDSYGLKLVQLPLREAIRLHEDHPFDQPVPVKLIVRPPARDLATPRLEPQSSSPRALKDPESHHKALLRKMDFVLDFEAARNFPSKMQARYSWGTLDYVYTQFVHKSGLLLVQISNNEEGDFIMLPNRLALHATIAPGRKYESQTVDEIAQKFVAFCRNEKALRAFYEENNARSGSTPSPLANASLTAEMEIPPFQLPPELNATKFSR